MVELVDAMDSKSISHLGVRVRFPPKAPLLCFINDIALHYIISVISVLIFFFLLTYLIKIFSELTKHKFFIFVFWLLLVFVFSIGLFYNTSLFIGIIQLLLATIMISIGFYMVYLSIFNSSLFAYATSDLKYKVIHIIVLILLLAIYFMSFYYLYNKFITH